MPSRLPSSSAVLCLVVAAAAGAGVGVTEVLANDYATQGLWRLAAEAFELAVLRYVGLGLLAGLFFRAWGWVLGRASRGPLSGRLQIAGAATGLTATLEAYLNGPFCHGAPQGDWLAVRVVLSVGVGMVAGGLGAVTGRGAGIELGGGRPRGAHAGQILAFLGLDVLFLVFYYVRFSFFISPLQLMAVEPLWVKLFFDLAWLSLRDGSPVTVRPAPLLAHLGATGLAAVASSAGWVVVPRHEPSPTSYNVVLIVVDALRADHLGTYGYERDTSPRLDAFAERALVAENAYANGASTKLSIPTLLTGLHVPSHGVRSESAVLAGRLPTLTEVLRDGGYRTDFYNAGNIYLHRRFGCTQGFEHVTFIPLGTGAQLTDRFIDDHDLDDHDLDDRDQRTGQPFFAYLHYMDVHTPYHRNPYTTRFTSGPLGRLEPGGASLYSPTELDLTAAEKQTVIDLYDGQIAYTDEQIGRVLDALAGAGLLERTYVLVTADHGEELWDHGGFGHAHTVYEELLRIPLVIAGPGVAAGRLATRTRMVDVAPTILELAGMPALPRAEGTSVLESAPDGSLGEDPPVFSSTVLGSTIKHGLLQGQLKTIVSRHPMPGGSLRDAWETFDLSTDPGETHDLGRGASGEMLLMREDVVAYAEGRAVAEPGRTVIDPAMREGLQALGYIE